MVIAFLDPADGPRGTLFAIVTNVVWLSAVAWGVTAEIHTGSNGGRVAAVTLLAAGTAGWLLWLVSRVLVYRWLRLPSWLLMAAAGGALSAFAPLALVFVGVAALVAGMTWPPKRAAMVASVGPLAALVSAWAAGTGLVLAVWATTSALGGLTLGIARRQTQEAAAQTARVEVSEARADAEQARAELLAGRNHLARELHDILAHTLSALSLQLEALDATIESGPGPAQEVRAQLDGIRRLVREGLDDARGAVRALREDLPPLEDQLAKLSDARHASLSVEGVPRVLAPDVSLALYRVAQEALTNAAKHAPGTTAAVDLAFVDGQVRLAVLNGPGAEPATGPNETINGRLAHSGAGYGLQGIRERVLLLGGQVEAGPAGGGWRVRAEVPA
jgi:signal transduction histidine kinase